MTIPAFQKTVLSWYQKNKRSMPWRETKDPYKILVSEVMLQQTQFSRVLPKYQEFLQEFPNPKSLAAAPNRKLLKTWRGLGYWKRALALKSTVQKLLKEHKGKFPKDPKVLETFPGIGPYTARAFACFAFGRKEAFLDTNIRRVYLHFFFQGKNNVADEKILAVAKKALLWKKNIREWHYALFDYGALVLKDKKLNRQSKHYAKQSRFEDSFRSFRTKVLRFLLDQPRQTATRRRIQRLLKEAKTPYASEKILSSLGKDSLIKKKRNSYSL